MELLKKIWDAISNLFSGNDISTKTEKNVRKNIVRGSVNGPQFQGNVKNYIIASDNSNVKVGPDIRVSKEEPTDQDAGDIWFEEIE